MELDCPIVASHTQIRTQKLPQSFTETETSHEALPETNAQPEVQIPPEKLNQAKALKDLNKKKPLIIHNETDEET